MPQLISPLAHLLMGRERTMHRVLGTEVPAFLEQGRVDLGRREIHEPRLVQHGENGHALRVAERAGRRSAARRGAL